jgi:hypothetical protein
VAHFGRRAFFAAASSTASEFFSPVTFCSVTNCLLELFHILGMTATGGRMCGESEDILIRGLAMAVYYLDEFPQLSRVTDLQLPQRSIPR